MTYVAEKPGPKRHLVMGTSPGNIKVEEKEVPKIIRAIEAAGKNVDHISMAKRFYTKTLAARKEISKLKEKGYRIFRESKKMGQTPRRVREYLRAYFQSKQSKATKRQR